MIYRESSQYDKSDTNLFKRLIRSLIFCMALCIVFIFIISLIVTYTDVSEAIINPSVNILRLFAILLVSIIFTFGERTRGWMKGLLSGAVFCVILYLTGVLFVENYTEIVSPAKLLLEGILLGMTGGIIGINLGGKKK